MGNFQDTDKTAFESVVHYTNTAVTLRLDCGPLRYHTLGVATIFRFLQTEMPEGHDTAQYGTTQALPSYEYLTFGRRGSEASFQLRYTVREVTSTYSFSLNEMTCLKQVGSWRADQMWAEIEFNHSPFAVDTGPVNRHRLGSFSTHDVASIHSNFNLTFTSISNFVITFYAKSLMTQAVVGVLKFTPLLEVFFNQQTLRDSSDKDDAADPAAPIDWLTALRGGLRMVHIDHAPSPDATLPEMPDITLADFTRSSTTRKRLHADVGGYEVLFTIAKTHRIRDEILPKTLWKRLNANSNDLEVVVVADPMGSTSADHTSEVLPSQNVNQKSVIHGNADVLASIERNTASRQKARFGSIDFGAHSSNNYVEVLIDGLQTFRRYYELMMEAKHSISILGWEISLSFGLTLEQVPGADFTVDYSNGVSAGQSRRWITLDDVLIAKAKEGVKVRVLVWRHELLSHLNRYLYLGEVTVESEMTKLERRCKRAGVSVKILHATRYMPSATSPYSRPYGTRIPMDMAEPSVDSSDPSRPSNAKSAKKKTPSVSVDSTAEFDADEDTDIVVIVAGNPKGLISSHHEKLVLIDAECPENCLAFTGGFDIARGRYDQPSHQVPLPGSKKQRDALYKREMEEGKEERLTGRSIQPVWRSIRFLWHDLQLMIKGPATRSLLLHFVQRWTHAFDPNPLRTRSITLLPHRSRPCKHTHPSLGLLSNHSSCVLRLERTWKSVFDVHYLFEDYCKMIKSAERFLYVEHQYPFQNFALTQLMCDQLKQKPNLHLIVVTPIKTDLPTGLVGELFDWSQDHIIQHLTMIQNTAPERVGVYGLINQDGRFPERIGGIYVHSKVTLIDDMWMVTGSTNMDNVSFFHSSELSIELYSPAIAREVRLRLFKEHLGSFYDSSLDDDLQACFNAFRDSAALNYQSLRETGLLRARPISLTPMDAYQLILSKVYYPNKATKLLMKLGLSTEDVIQVVGDGVDNVVNFVVQKAKL